MRTVSGDRVMGRARVLRRLAVCAAATLILGAGGHAVLASEQIILPYECRVENGRVIAEPSSDQAYRIFGSRDHQPHRACSPSTPGRCRTFMLHRFSMACDGGRVSWPAFYAAISDETDGRAVLDGGRLHMQMGPQWRSKPRGFPWRQRDGYGSGDRDRRGFDEPGFGGRNRDAVVELPPGYAPLTGTRAIFTALDPRVAAANIANDRPEPVPRPGEMNWDDDDAAGQRTVAPQKSDEPKTSEPVRSAEVPPPQRKPLVPAETKAVEVKPGKPAEAAPKLPVAAATPATKLESKSAAVTATAETQRDRPVATTEPGALSPAVPGTSFAPTILNNPAAPKPSAPNPATVDAVDLTAAAPSPLGAIATAAPEKPESSAALPVALPPAAEPPPKVVAAETIEATIETGAVAPNKTLPAWPMPMEAIVAAVAAVLLLASLLILRRQSAQPVVRGARRGPVFEPMLPGLPLDPRDGVDAGKQLVVAPQPDPVPEPTLAASFDAEVFVVPKTRSEALAVLGLSGAANETMIRKVVEALRQSWHPDTASSDDDRRVREARVKQINVAADILAG